MLNNNNIFFSVAYISRSDNRYSNNSAISMTEFGKQDDALLCHTNFMYCCTTSDGGNFSGFWKYPNGSFVPSSIKGYSFYISRISGAVMLHRIHILTSISGIFTCVVPISHSMTESLHIFLYSGDLPGNAIF